MRDIDFLPDSYRQMRLRRKQRVWRRAALGVLLVLIALGAVGQRQTRANLDISRDKVRANAQRMAAQIGDPEELRKEIAFRDNEANLLAMLRLKVSPTRLLATVTNSLPRFVTLTEFNLQYEAVPQPPANRNQPPAPAANPDPSAAQKPAEVKDLDDLRKVAEETSMVLYLQGVAPDDIVIASYLAALQQSNLFAEVALQTIDHETVEKAEMRRFKTRLRVKQPKLSLQISDPKN